MSATTTARGLGRLSVELGRRSLGISHTLSARTPTITRPLRNCQPVQSRISNARGPVTQLLGIRSFFWSSKQPVEVDVKPAAIPTPAPAAAPEAVTATTDLPPTLIDNTIPSFIAESTTIPEQAIEPTLKAIEHIGDLKTLGLSNWTPAGLAQSLLEAVYVTTGLPWWATIMVTTVLIRTALLPLTLKAQRAAAKLSNISPKIKPIQAEMARLREEGDIAGSQRAAMKMQTEFKAAGVNPLSGLLALLQAPVVIGFFFGLKGMAELPVPGFDTGGLAWFTDLTVQDPYFVLPVVASMTLLTVFEVGADVGTGATQFAGMKTFMRLIVVASIFFTSHFPAGVFMYWISTNAFSLAQTLALKRPPVRKFFNIPMVNKVAAAAADGRTQRLTLEGSFKAVKQATEAKAKRDRPIPPPTPTEKS
ncbi:60Kd inner membrane protein-domain-containing protein [Phlyctochytrium arcticum]|nr:60Kd inner membrane protein-domain-containing protein [Phlyctochytrium arcticum]